MIGPAKIETETQYNWAVQRVEELLPLVNDDTPETDQNYIELVLLSNLVADYSEEHYHIGEPSSMESDEAMVRRNIISSLEDVLSHMQGRITLPDARDILL